MSKTGIFTRDIVGVSTHITCTPAGHYDSYPRVVALAPKFHDKRSVYASKTCWNRLGIAKRARDNSATSSSSSSRYAITRILNRRQITARFTYRCTKPIAAAQRVDTRNRCPDDARPARLINCLDDVSWPLPGCIVLQQ